MLFIHCKQKNILFNFIIIHCIKFMSAKLSASLRSIQIWRASLRSIQIWLDYSQQLSWETTTRPVPGSFSFGVTTVQQKSLFGLTKSERLRMACFSS